MSAPTPDHYREAERLVALAEEHWMEPEGGDYEPTDDVEELETRNEIREAARVDAMTWLAMAQVHATLATATPSATVPAGFEPVDPTAMRIGVLEEELSATRMQRDEAVEQRDTVGRKLADAYVECERLRELIAELYDKGPCQYDHHDQCKGHNLDPRPCPHGRAAELLADGGEPR